jgi:L-aspartate oxidase
MKQFDFLILGSGIAGLFFALKAAAHGRVAIVTKKNSAESNTNYAQGGIAAVISKEDSFELHVRDTLEAGAGLCNEKAVRTIVEEGPARIAELIQLGMHFSEREVPGPGKRELDLGREGGHSKRRILHAKDITGREVERALLAAAAEQPNIVILENHFAIDLITSQKLSIPGPNRCLGAYVLDKVGGAVETYSAPVILLATGGCGKVYLYTTNPDIATGDGVAMAYRAGAPVANMEFIQFHPTCLYHPRAKSFLISEAVRGEGGVLKTIAGAEFMDAYHPMKSLAPRDIVARAIDSEMKEVRGRSRVPRHHAQAGAFCDGAFPKYLQHLPGLWHRHHQGTDPGGARGALPVRRRCDEYGRAKHPFQACIPLAKWPAPGCTAPTAWPAIHFWKRLCAPTAPP